MNQQVTISPTRLNPSTAETDVNAFKRVLLSIILTLSYIEAYNADERKIKVPPAEKGKRASTKRIRNITGLRRRVGKFNSNVRQPVEGKESREKGSSDSVFKLSYELLPKKSALVDCYNQITAAPLSDNLYGGVANLLSKNVDANLASYIDCINSFVYCQHLLYEAFDFFDPFDYKLVSEKPDLKPNTSVDEFIDKGRKLSQCIINFRQDAPMPLSAFPKLPATGQAEETVEPASLLKIDLSANTGQQPAMADQSKSSFQEINTSTETEPSEYTERCLAHHLNFERQIVLADTVLTWKDTRLIRVVMEQREEFRKGAGKNTFVGEALHIINEDRTIYIVLKAAQNPAIQMQVTMERNPDELGQRNGLFSYMKYKEDDQHTPAVPFSGLVVLQTVPEKLNLDQLEQELKRASDSLPNRLVVKHITLRNALRIRYRILDQVATLPKSLAKAEAAPWTSLQDCVGRYVCYYMRLSNVPAKFEISQIQIFADGRATLRQPPDEATFEGYVRVNGNRLWIFFRPSYDEVTGKEPIRFMVDKGVANGRRIFRGIFSSQTMTERKLVSGRMLMKLLLPKEQWPKPFSIDFKQLNYYHLPDPEDRVFFMEQWKSDTNLTDGPIWAEVANRLQERSAMSILNQLCTDPTLNKELFNRSQFYYYSFKNDSDEEDLFFIQRDLLTFYSNGTVTVEAGEIVYKGFAYYHQKTLRLSLTNAEHGFLEIFLSVLGDKSDPSSISILYGQSLWRSGSRIQGKNIVLSRPERGKLRAKQENFYFLDPTDKRFKYQLKRLHDEDVRGNGVISYQRGEVNRFTHTTANASHGQFRPRDQRFREMHFLIACCYGFQRKQAWPLPIEPPTDAYNQWLKRCQTFLKEAFTHGYACDFAGISLSLDGDVPPYAEVEAIYHERMPTARRNNPKTTDIINRMRQIAAEQRFLRRTFAKEGPLEFDELYNYASHFWPKLLPERSKTAP